MFRRFAVLAAVAALVPAAALAHHGWSSYDAAKTIKVTAPVTQVAWENPHATGKVAYQGKTWDVILAPLARMEARGLSREMLLAGKPITPEGYPRTDGVAEMRLERVIVEGKTVELR